MKNIVWLTEWFPTAFQPYSGDSIERLAKAASLFDDIFIVFVKKKPGLQFPKIEKEERIFNEHCRAVVYYYPSLAKWGRILDFFVSNFFYARLHARALAQYKKKYGKPAGIQVNVAMRNGLVALFYAWWWKLRYIVVERWGGFLPEAKPHFREGHLWSRFFTRIVLRKAALVIAPSAHLAETLKREITDGPFQIIPNVVDASIFFPQKMERQSDVFRFIHVSSLDFPKNFESILQATKMVTEKGHKIELLVIGPTRESLYKLSEGLGLANIVSFVEEAPQVGLANYLRNSDALILYSRYETFGNVIIEANAIGLPVIVSDYPSFRDNVIDGKTGLITKGDQPEKLAEKMIYIMNHYDQFDSAWISRLTLDKFGYEAVGKNLHAAYQKYFK